MAPVSSAFGSDKCVCPKCGKELVHSQRGTPCSKLKCPDCGTPMRGARCMEKDR
jgi:predicted RNA-binding Zn-ribbon protein involved in translation (DUF1610 family)